MPILGDCESEPSQPGQQEVDQDHADTRRHAGAHRKDEQEQVAVAQPRLGTAGIGGRCAGLFYSLGRCELSDLGDSVFCCTGRRRSP